jgi:hypothetical protein
MCMYRAFSMYPKSADPLAVAGLIERTVAAFKASQGFLAATTSVDALMGPSARSGDFGRILEVDFETLEDALAAVGSEALADTKAQVEALQPMLLLYEVVDA